MTAEQAAALLEALADDLPRQGKEAACRAAEEMAQKARELAPVATGALRDSIAAVPGEDGAAVVASAPYAAAVELGSFRTPPRPFLGPALALWRPE